MPDLCRREDAPSLRCRVTAATRSTTTGPVSSRNVGCRVSGNPGTYDTVIVSVNTDHKLFVPGILAVFFPDDSSRRCFAAAFVGSQVFAVSCSCGRRSRSSSSGRRGVAVAIACSHCTGRSTTSRRGARNSAATPFVWSDRPTRRAAAIVVLNSCRFVVQPRPVVCKHRATAVTPVVRPKTWGAR
jgi:hypothetical protein